MCGWFLSPALHFACEDLPYPNLATYAVACSSTAGRVAHQCAHSYGLHAQSGRHCNVPWLCAGAGSGSCRCAAVRTQRRSLFAAWQFRNVSIRERCFRAGIRMHCGRVVVCSCCTHGNRTSRGADRSQPQYPNGATAARSSCLRLIGKTGSIELFY